MDEPSSSADTCSLSVTDIGDDPGQVLIRDESNIFKSLRTIPIAVLQLILQASFFAESLWLFQPSKDCKNQTITSNSVNSAITKSSPDILSYILCHRVSILTYSYNLLWAVALMMDWWRKFLHRDRRNMGYLLIYDNVATVSRIPVTAMTVGGFLLLIALALDRQGVLFDGSEIFGKPSIWIFLIILVGCEFIVTFASLAVYIGRVHRFNTSQPVPDIFNVMNISSMPVIFNSRSLAEIGPGIQDCNKDMAVLQTVCERQGDMIKYLRRRCDVLCEKLQESSSHNA